MIRNWRYDEGKPHYMSVIKQWTDPRPPSWHCVMYARECDVRTVQDWFEEHIPAPSECELRLNSGNLALFIFIVKEEDATLFKLTWG